MSTVQPIAQHSYSILIRFVIVPKKSVQSVKKFSCCVQKI